jgi:LysR family glycine cleavage system transcriptional activator
MERPHERRRLPPLNALRAFEAAARHLNFSRAADELSVTPGAVSQQIQNLEDYVGAPLFKRTPKGLLLTDAAQTALPALREAFDRLAEAASLLTAAVDGWCRGWAPSNRPTPRSTSGSRPASSSSI